ncbi:hypothetical protein H0H92_006409 [Tricholoma furcatifolium]|nr:hypothetical protein H0H92_006409 [Tricholoma furcatifolium]
MGRPAVPFPIDWKRKQDAGNGKPEGNRDWERRNFSTHLITDIKRILYERGVSVAECNKEIAMHWVDWADYAYSRKVCLVNWPVLASKPGPGFKYKKKGEGIQTTSIKTSLDLREKVKVWSTHGPLNYIGVVSWSKEHMDLDEKSLELADVPLCINKAGAVVVTVKDATCYGKKRAAAAMRHKLYVRPDSDADEDENDNNDDDDEEEEEEERPPKRRRQQAGVDAQSDVQGAGPSSESSSMSSVLPAGMDPKVAAQVLQLFSTMQSKV